ncbi:hypothetical protein ACNQVK_01835 [Mycobacterium sp. 134]|uniref:hypothetical protein n=1 Tax=Mycobacterium sp. 134 TaxID=3400425 RepID=UPI003AAC62E9
MSGSDLLAAMASATSESGHPILWRISIGLMLVCAMVIAVGMIGGRMGLGGTRVPRREQIDGKAPASTVRSAGEDDDSGPSTPHDSYGSPNPEGGR